MAVRKKNTPAKENKTKSKASKPVSKRTLTKTTSTKRSITARSGPRALTRSAAADIAQPTRISSDFSRNALGIDISLFGV